MIYRSSVGQSIVHAQYRELLGDWPVPSAPRPEPRSPAYAEWLDDVLDGLGVEQFSVVGFSLGAWFALDYATHRPGRNRRMALLLPQTERVLEFLR